MPPSVARNEEKKNESRPPRRDGPIRAKDEPILLTKPKIMEPTYTQLYIHFVFSVKKRNPLITENIRPRLQRYITGLMQKRGNKMLSIYCMPDHCHILIGWNPEYSISQLMKEVKSYSSKWVNKNQLAKERFYWQQGYGAFSCAKDAISTIGNYIDHQPHRHKTISFHDEYNRLLEDHGIIPK